MRRKLHLAYKNMRTRCDNPRSKSWPNYGGRGISVCHEWTVSRDSFINWALSNGVQFGLSLDRIDNNGNYSPQNCRWSTLKEQLRNQQRTRWITFGGVTMAASAWAEEVGVRPDTILHRLSRGMNVDDVLAPDDLRVGWSHGSRTAYEKKKCRCDLCRSEHARRHREMRAKRKATKHNT